MKLATSTMALVFCAPIVLAADPATGDEQTRAPRSPDYCVLSDIVGAKVTMHPGAKEVAEANKDNEEADRPKGKINDILLDSCSGETVWAVVTFDKKLGVGGKTVVVPYDLLAWNRTDECFDLAQSDDQLKALPEFDKDDAKEKGMDAQLAAYTGHWPNATYDHRHETLKLDDPTRTDRTKGSDDVKRECPVVMIDGRPCACAKPQFIFATDIDDAKVHAQDGEFGKVETNLIDRANGRVALLAVKHGGTLGVGGDEILLPFDGLCIHENDKGRAYCTNHTIRELEAGVRYDKPEKGAIDPAAASRAKEFFAKLDGATHDHR